MGRRFRFESFWTKAEGFFEVVTFVWNSIPSIGNQYVVLDQKLQATAKFLQRWSDKWIGNIKLQIAIALEVIQCMDIVAESRKLSLEDRALRKLLKRKLLGLCSLERSIARQRPRLLWLREGDVSTQFFRQHANHRHRRNVITCIQKDGVIPSGHEQIVDGVHDYF